MIYLIGLSNNNDELMGLLHKLYIEMNTNAQRYFVMTNDVLFCNDIL
jgi:hypothetical protein